MDWKKHLIKVGSHSVGFDDLPDLATDEGDKFIDDARKRIEPWLSAVFQAEHFNLLLGSGFSTAIGYLAGVKAAGMDKVAFGTSYDDKINAHAEANAKSMGRGTANIEDQFRSALAVLDGLSVLDNAEATKFKLALDVQLKAFLDSLLTTENGISAGKERV